jgi:hypothetical protein
VYGHSRRRKSAVQIHWIRLSRMTVSPKVTMSEVSSLIRKRRKPSSSRIPTTKKPGAMTRSVRIGSSPCAVASW